MHDIGQSKPRQVQQAKRDDDALPAEIAAGYHHQNESDRRYRHRDPGADSKRAQRQGDGGKFRDQS